MTEQLPIESYHWEPKLSRFCEILGVQPSDYQDSQASQTPKLRRRLKEFDTETLLALMSEGAEICCQVLEPIERYSTVNESINHISLEKNGKH